MSKKLIVCDVCDTLYRSNTTFDFIRYVVNQRGKSLFSFHLLTNRKSPLFYMLTAIGKLTGQDLIRILSLKFLKEIPLHELSSLADNFYFDFLIHRPNENVFRLLPTEDRANVILFSSSLDVIVAVIARENNLNFESSRLGWKEGKATGNLTLDLTGKKHEVVKLLVSAGDFDQLQVITDNRSDWELVKLANERFVVIKKDNEKEFWRELKPVFIEV